MRINSLFEHDATMKRQAEADNSIIALKTGSESAPNGSIEVQQMNPPKQSAGNSSKETKGEKGRHRASIACASCRDRRIRVS